MTPARFTQGEKNANLFRQAVIINDGGFLRRPFKEALIKESAAHLNFFQFLPAAAVHIMHLRFAQKRGGIRGDLLVDPCFPARPCDPVKKNGSTSIKNVSDEIPSNGGWLTPVLKNKVSIRGQRLQAERRGGAGGNPSPLAQRRC